MDMPPAYQAVSDTMKDSGQRFHKKPLSSSHRLRKVSIVSTFLYSASCFALLAHRQLQRWPWFMLRLTSSGIGVPVARTHAPQAKFRQVPAPITRVQPLLSGRCTCSVTWIFKTPRSRGETDIKDVFVTFKELTIFD